MKKPVLVACLALVALFVLSTAPAAAQTVKNPSAVEFNCPDHDQDDQHELTILRVEGTNKVVITTILLGDPVYADPATKLVRSDLNVQPIAFGTYVARVNAVAGTLKSADSPESDPFDRVPGGPSKPKWTGEGGGQ